MIVNQNGYSHRREIGDVEKLPEYNVYHRAMKHANFLNALTGLKPVPTEDDEEGVRGNIENPNNYPLHSGDRRIHCNRELSAFASICALRGQHDLWSLIC